MKRIILLVLVLSLGLAAEVANADFTFGTPTNIGPTINTSVPDYSPCMSADGLSLYFASYRQGGHGLGDICLSTRETTEDDWGPPMNLGPMVNSSAGEYHPAISTDELELYFERYYPGSLWGGHISRFEIWVTKRATKSDPWGQPVKLDLTVSNREFFGAPSLPADGLELYFTASPLEPETSLYVTKRETKDAPWGEPVSLGPTVNNWSSQTMSRISSDGLLLVFCDLFVGSPRPGGFGDVDMWYTRRATKDSDWEEPVNLGPLVNTAFRDYQGMISPDGSTLYFSSTRPGGFGNWDLWQATVLPIVDLNCDGIVDADDMCIIIDHWGENYSLCDIGPMPWGDGIVDVQDLIVLAEHLFEDYRLIAHWAMDETEGIVAHDSAGDNGAYVIGDPVWLPTGGMMDGALQLDGVDDCVITGSISNPTEGPFSVLVWIKGGAPGQAVLSQMGGVRWFCADPSEGNLMTELKGAGRGAAELLSQTIITDGNWHRIGLVWDGSHRQLYVDGIAVAEDMQDNLEASENGLYIGTGKSMEPGSFWSGLIDDVRIYNRAVTP